MSVRNVLVILGTRPEAVKLAPVVWELKHRPRIDVRLCLTGQHDALLAPMLYELQLEATYRLNALVPGQSLAALSARLLSLLDPVLAEAAPDLVVVQGDTASALMGALVAFYHHVPVAHIEAGLRSHDLSQPFPEEANRRLADHLSSLWFAPSEGARQHLLNEGIPAEKITVTGNTGIDTLHWANQYLPKNPPPHWHLPKLDPQRRLILVTAHRRENAANLGNICQALGTLSETFSDVEIVFPAHLNPEVQQAASAALHRRPRIHVTPPLNYLAFIYLLRKTHLLLTDSGGLQEEAPSLGVPVLVLREVTERPEGVEAGSAILVGTHPDTIIAQAARLLEDNERYRRMAQPRPLYGDGQAASRIVARLCEPHPS